MMRGWWIVLVILCMGVGWAAAQDTSADFYIEASVDNPTPFVGQQIIYTIRVYAADDQSDESPLYEPPDFEGFWRVDIQPFPFAQSPQQVNGRAYIVSEIRTALYPTLPGDLFITPANVVLPETVFRPEQRIGSNPVIVKAQPLPEGAPAEFTGAVGQFELLATLDRQSVMLGEPVTLRLTARGTGNVEQLAPPQVPTLRGWQIFANPGSYTAVQDNGHIIGEKVFAWSLIPNQTGMLVLPEISLAYFDPSRLTYQTLNTASASVEVLPGSTGATSAAEFDAAPAVNGLMPVKPVPATFTSVTLPTGWFFWLLWLVPPVAVVVGFGWVKRQQRRRLRQNVIRRSEALKHAQERLHAAAKAPPDRAYRFIHETIRVYFCDKMGWPPGRLSQADIQRVLAERKVTPEIGKRVLAVLERANEAQYAPVSAVDSRQLAGYTLDTLKLLDAAWEP